MKAVKIIILAACVCHTSLAAYAASGDGMADFLYDPITGALSVDPDGESVWSMNFSTLEDALSTNTPANWAFADFGCSIEWSDQFAGAFPLTSPFELGTLSDGLTGSDFGQVLYFVTADTDEHFGAVEVVPEPATLMLLGLGGLAMVSRRR